MMRQIDSDSLTDAISDAARESFIGSSLFPGHLHFLQGFLHMRIDFTLVFCRIVYS